MTDAHQSAGAQPATAAVASVALPGRRSELRTFPLVPCSADSGWLRVEASGICGTDVSLYDGRLGEACILGHHVVGEIVDVGDAAALRWAAGRGDRVALEEYLPCGNCPACNVGRYRLCPVTDLWREGRRVGLLPIAEPPALWGGNAQYMYLPPNAVFHKLPRDIPIGLAVWALPLANALDWTLGAGALAPGETVVIIGPGYHGLAAVAAARYGSAGQIIVCGLASDRARLQVAQALGATTVESPSQDPLEVVSDLTAGRLADVVLDLAGSGPETLGIAASLLGQFGRLVLAGVKSPSTAQIDTSLLIRRLLTVRGVRGRAPERVTQSIELLASGASGLEKVPTAEVPLAEVGQMLDRLVAKSGPDTPHVVVRPWLGTAGTVEAPAS